MDQALPCWLSQSVPAHAPKCPQSLQPGVGPGLAPGGPSQRNRRNTVPMRTSAFYFLPTMFSWQTRHSHDRGLGSKPRGQHNRYHRNAEVNNTSTASGTPRHLPLARTPSLGTGRLWSTVPPGLSPTVDGSTGLPLPLSAPHSLSPAPWWQCQHRGHSQGTSAPTRCWESPGGPCQLTSPQPPVTTPCCPASA